MNSVNPDYWMGMIHICRLAVALCHKLRGNGVSALQMVKPAAVITVPVCDRNEQRQRLLLVSHVTRTTITKDKPHVLKLNVTKPRPFLRLIMAAAPDSVQWVLLGELIAYRYR